MKFRTPDAAVRWAVFKSPLRSRAIDPGAVYTGDGGHNMAEAVEVHSRIWAIIGKLTPEAWRFYKAWVCTDVGYAAIARAAHCDWRTVKRHVDGARAVVKRRLVEQDLCEP